MTSWMRRFAFLSRAASRCSMLSEGAARNDFNFFGFISFRINDRRTRDDRSTLRAIGRPVSTGGGRSLNRGPWTSSGPPGGPPPPPRPALTPQFAQFSTRGRAFLPASIRRPAKRESPPVTSTASASGSSRLLTPSLAPRTASRSGTPSPGITRS